MAKHIYCLIYFNRSSLGENAITQKMAEEEERKQLQREQENTWYHEGKTCDSNSRILNNFI